MVTQDYIQVEPLHIMIRKIIIKIIRLMAINDYLITNDGRKELEKFFRDKRIYEYIEIK